jgi:hypothetical protein
MFVRFELSSPEFPTSIWIEVDKIAYLTPSTDGKEVNNCTCVHVAGAYRVIHGSPEETLAKIAQAREEALKKVYRDNNILHP